MRAYTVTFYLRIVRLYRRMPAKKVARLMRCSESMVRSAKHRLKSCNELQRAKSAKVG